MKRLTHYLILLTLLVLAGCSTSRKMDSATKAPMPTESRSLLSRAIQQRPPIQMLQAKAQFTLQIPGKSEKSIGGSLRMVRGEGIQLSIAPLLGIEMFRAEFTPLQVTLINRLSRQYTECTYRELSDRLHTTVDYPAIQALFMNELFIGDHPISSSDIRQFQAAEAPQSVSFLASQGSIRYQFDINRLDNFLITTRLQSSDYRMIWDYSDFEKVAAIAFPSSIHVRLEKGSHEARLSLSLNRLRINEPTELNGGVSSRYTRVSIDELLKQIQDKQ